MRHIMYFLVLLTGFAVHGDTDKKTALLNDFLKEVYESEVPVEESVPPQITEQLQNYLPVCPTAPEGSDFLEAVSCSQLMDKAKASSISRFKMQSLIKRGVQKGTIDEARQEELSAVLEEVYGQESPQKTREREQLISYFQNCDPDHSWMDAAQFWNDTFGCKGSY